MAGINALAQGIVDLVTGADPRTHGMMPGWDIELARQKLLFLTAPRELGGVFQSISDSLANDFHSCDSTARARLVSFMLGVAESLLSPVELDHNLRAKRLHGSGAMSEKDAAAFQQAAADLVRRWAAKDPEAFLNATAAIKLEDLATSKGDNPFAGWAKRWERKNGRDPYANLDDYLACFGALYQRGVYYPDLYFAREAGKTRTQFFNDYPSQAVRCRRMGSLGGTTNPALAVAAEDDFTGDGNVWGREASDFVSGYPNRWHEVRKVIAREQADRSETNEWAATQFTEWVVVDAMLGLRSIFLLRGLGRVSFQLRPDWHDDEKKLTYAGAEVYAYLCERVRLFDDILLDGASDLYHNTAAPRVGKANNHFKIACTGQTGLNVIRSFNAGYSQAYPDALKERMFTNATLSYEVPQMYAASLATEDGIRDYEKRTGEKVDDGEGGSVVTSFIGRFNDAIRLYRLKELIAMLPDKSKFKQLDPTTVKSFREPAVNNVEFILQLRDDVGYDFDPGAEEDAIDRAATLCTKRVVKLLENKLGLKRTRILTASKRNFRQNTELLDVPFSTDGSRTQRDLIRLLPLKIENWRSICEGMDDEGYPIRGTIWARRHDTLTKIWPDWKRVFEIDGVKPEEYADMIYVRPTLDQFIAKWNENVSRAKHAGSCSPEI